MTKIDTNVDLMVTVKPPLFMKLGGGGDSGGIDGQLGCNSKQDIWYPPKMIVYFFKVSLT